MTQTQPPYNQPYQQHGPPVFQQPAPKPPKRKRTVPLLLFILGTAGGLLVGCVGGTAMTAAGNTAEAQPGPTKYITVPGPTVTVPAPAKPAAVAPTTAAAPAPPAAKPVPTIEDGIWTVGEDVPAGTYKVLAAVTDSCYWGIYKSGTNQSDIIENAIVEGGFPKVTIKKGQDFESNGCGIWRKV